MAKLASSDRRRSKDGGYPPIESAGYLVPESESEAIAGGRDPVQAPRVAARLLLGTAFGWIDRVRLAYDLMQRLAPGSSER